MGQRTGHLESILEEIRQYVGRLDCRLSKKAELGIYEALAKSRGLDTDLYSEALLYGLIKAGSIVVPLLDNLHVSPAGLRNQCASSLRVSAHDPWAPDEVLSPRGTLVDVLGPAATLASEAHRREIYSSDLLLSLVDFSLRGVYELSSGGDRAFHMTKAQRVAAQQSAPDGQHGYEDDGLLGSGFHNIIDARGLTLSDMQNEVVRIRHFEPYVEEILYQISFEGRRCVVTPFSFFNAYRMCASEAQERMYITKVNVPTHIPVFAGNELEELERLVNQSSTTEYDLQRFFERYPKFLMTLGYRDLHSQLTLVSETNSSLRPDFFAERFAGDFCDIIDLKKPNVKLVSGPARRRGFSYRMTLALNQLREYRDYFEDASNRRDFHERYGLNAYRPKITVVIGRAYDFRDEFERKQITDEYSHLDLVTYDDIINRIKSTQIVLP